MTSFRTEYRFTKPQRDPLEDLVSSFSEALLAKLKASREKYQRSDPGWQEDGWRDSLLRQMHEHIAKGDPIDVAAYCAFAWHHGWKLEDNR